MATQQQPPHSMCQTCSMDAGLWAHSHFSNLYLALGRGSLGSCKRAQLAMVLMKAVQKKRSGNSAPHKRIPFPEVSQDALDKAMHSYCRAMGIKEAFNMYQYKNLQAQQSESPQSIAQLARLLEALLGVSSSAKIKYKALKQSFVVLLQTWGVQLLKAHWEMDDSMLAGRAADSVDVLLKHWRRCSSSEVAWGKLVGKLDESEAAALERLRKKTTWDGKQEPKKRQLKLHNSEVSQDSHGWPKMVAQPVPSEAEDSGDEEMESESQSGSGSSCKLSGLDESPPPCLKKDWRANAMKRPAAESESIMKKPSSSSSKSEEVKAKPPLGPGKGPTSGTEKVLIDQGSISTGGGKNQSYLQHQPGPGKNKRLIAAVTLSQASRTTKTHQQLVQLLLPSAKKPKATKADVLAEREKLFAKFAK